MEVISEKIKEKLSHIRPILYQLHDKTDDYEFDLDKLWIPYSEFLILQSKFPFFSTQAKFSGILFCKSKKSNHSDWFKTKFYCIYKDHLVLYSKKNDQLPKKVMLLSGVHLSFMSEFFNSKDLMRLSNKDIIDNQSFVLSRKNNFEIYSAGTDEMYKSWTNELKKCCILHSFKKNYELLKILHPGNESTVYEANSLKNNIISIVKIFDKTTLIKNIAQFQGVSKNKFAAAIENEINLLKRLLNHDNILQLNEVYETKKKIVLIFDKLKGGDLDTNKIPSSFHNKFNENNIKTIMKQLLLAVKFLHDNDIMHRDIKKKNVFFVNPNDLQLKLGDFGLAEYASKQKFVFRRCGTPGYVAPEILLKQPYNKKCDLFSLGSLLYNLIAGKMLFDGKSRNEVVINNCKAEEIIKNQDFDKLKVSKECIDLLKKLLQTNYQERCTADEALSHKWFENSTNNDNILENMNELVESLNIDSNGKIKTSNNFSKQLPYLKTGLGDDDLSQPNVIIPKIIIQNSKKIT